MNNTIARRLAWAPLMLFTLACGDGTGPELSDLSQAEAGALLAALSAVWFPSPSAPSQAPAGPLLAPVTTVTNDTTDVVVPCAAGGTASVLTISSLTFTIDSRLNPSPDTTSATNIDYVGTSNTIVTHTGCVSADGQGGTWSFDTDPGLTFEYSFDGGSESYALTGQNPVVMTELNWSGSWLGSFDWSNANRSGSCTISLTFTSATTNNGGQFTTSFSQQGQICGLDVSTSS